MLPYAQPNKKNPRDITDPNQKLEALEAWYTGKQYDALKPWHPSRDYLTGQYIPKAQRRPKITFPLAAVFCNRARARLVGEQHFPTFTMDTDPMAVEIMQEIIKQTQSKSFFLRPTAYALAAGVSLVCFDWWVGMIKPVMRWFPGSAINWEEIERDEYGNIQSISIKYKYWDKAAKAQVEYGRKWDSTQMVEMRTQGGQQSGGEKSNTFVHGFGFPPVVLLRTTVDPNEPMGCSVVEDSIDIFDSINYNASSSDRAIEYTNEPQPFVRGLKTRYSAEVFEKSVDSVWDLGPDGEAGFVEAANPGVEQARQERSDLRMMASQACRVFLHDPEKIKGAIDSSEALMKLDEPFVELISELRAPIIESGVKAMLEKILLAYLIRGAQGQQTDLNIPPGYLPRESTFGIEYKPIHMPTTSDKQAKIQYTSSATQGNLISRLTATEHVGEIFGVEDPIEEQDIIQKLPVPPSSFSGGFF